MGATFSLQSRGRKGGRKGGAHGGVISSRNFVLRIKTYILSGFFFVPTASIFAIAISYFSMARISSESDKPVDSLLRSSALNGEVEMQQIDRRTRHHHGWVSKAAAFPWVRPRYYLTTIGILVVLSILFLLQQHKEALAVHFIPSKPSPIAQPSLIAKPSLIVKPSLIAKPSSDVKPSLIAKPSSDAKPSSTAKPSSIAKPENLKIIALIFYGRPETVSILDCYMKQNLASNGGFLDEVHWAVNTDNKDSLKYLDELVKTSNGYKKIVLPNLGFESIWEHAVERGNLYIKIDDDIVRRIFG